MKTTHGYYFYWSGPFSQWQSCRIELWGLVFNCAEQAMMLGKARLFKDEEREIKIMQASDLKRQKALGQQVRGFDEEVWGTKKVALVTEINLAKFGQNKGLRRKLFQTAPKLLVEASPVDTIWGIGLDAETARQTPEAQWPGKNLLGQILTDTRDQLTTQFPDEAKLVVSDMGENT